MMQPERGMVRHPGVVAVAKSPILVAMAVLIAITGCSRLTFVRPEMGRKDFERTAPESQFQTDDRKRGPVSAHLLIGEGQQHLARGDLAAAKKAATQAVKQAPASAQAHTLMALVEDRSGSGASAGQHYRKAAELAPTQGAMLNNYGTWLCGHGRALESLDWFNRALADPAYGTPAMALANAGACAQRAGIGERADQYLAAAVELDPTNPVALGILAEREFRAGNALRARAFSQRRLAAAPADADALLLASQIEDALGDKAAAARYVQRLRVEFPAAPGAETGNGGNR